MSKSQQDKPDQTSDADWGIDDSPHDRRSQVRIALIMIVSLLGALGFFVYRKYDERRAAVTQVTDFQTDATSPGLDSTPESDTHADPGTAPTPSPDIDLIGPLDAGSTELHANTIAADNSDSAFPAPSGRAEPLTNERSRQPLADAEWNPQPLDASGDWESFPEEAVPLQQAPPDESFPVASERAIDLFGVPEEPPESRATDSFEPAAPGQPTVDNEPAIDLFGTPEEPSLSQTANSFEPAAAEQPTVDNEPVLDLFGMPEESPTSQTTNSFAPVSSDQPTVDYEPTVDPLGNPEQTPTDQAADPFERAPAERSNSDREPAIDLFGTPEEQSTSRTGNPFGAASTAQATTAATQPADPFTMTEEPQPATTPNTVEAAPEPFLVAPPASPEPDGAPWQTQLPAGPGIEPVEGAEASTGWQQEPDLIRVDSDQQIGDTTRQAGFDDPFFPAEQEEAAEVESAPSIDFSGTPATLDFGTPAQQVPGVPGGEPDPAPSIDWSSPAGGSTGESDGLPFESGATPTGTRNSDPFAGAAVSSPGAANRTDDSVQVHTVRRGDSYWSVARRFYGAGRYFRALAAYNQSRIPDPNDLQVGMKVLVPERNVLEQRFPALLGGAYVPQQRAQSLPAGFFMSRDGQPMFRVGSNDTLSSIAEAHLGRASRWRQIYGMNRDRLQNADHLQLGLELRLPADASQAELVSRPATFR